VCGQLDGRNGDAAACADDQHLLPDAEPDVDRSQLASVAPNGHLPLMRYP
jgi:hypothetical protein